MNKNNYYFLIFIGMAFWSACIDEISLDIDNKRQFVIVNGFYSDEETVHQIKLDYSPVIGVGNDNILTPISGAAVVVTGDDGSSINWIENVESPGTYETDLPAQNGVSYTLTVKTNDGQEIKSFPVKTPAKLNIADSLEFDVVTLESFNAQGNIVSTNFVDVLSSLDLTSSTNKPYLRWRVNGEYQFQERYPRALDPKTCYVKERLDFNNIVISNTNELATEKIEKQRLLRTVLNDRFLIMYCFHVTQYSISRDEYNYWSRVNELVNIEGNLFDPPPGSIKGNLYDASDEEGRVQGYFSVASGSSKRIFVDVAKRNFFAPQNCSLSFRDESPEKCSDCLKINGSSYSRPSYWVF